MRVSIHTLGCKLNQAESDSLSAAFSDAGWLTEEGVKNETALFIVNSCTVTSKAEQKLRRLVRLLQKKPNSIVLVTGCAVKENYSKDGVYYAAGMGKAALLELAKKKAPAGKAELASFIESWFSQLGGEAMPFEFDAKRVPRSRPFLKIQDGCDRRCAYCAVPEARGKSQSLDIKSAVSRLAVLEKVGYAEAALAGVNICSWRGGGGEKLDALIKSLLEGTAQIRLRLSSLQPDAVDGALLEALAAPRIRPHFHISVQSGSARILGAMGRSYDAALVEELCEKLRRIKKDPFLACDIITGFPGERDADFEESYKLCQRCGFAWIHAFPFSPRAGTPAAALKARVPERISVERTARLIELAVKQKAEYQRRWAGRVVEVVPENIAYAESSVVTKKNAARRVKVVTENYIKCSVSIDDIFADKNNGTIRYIRFAVCLQNADARLFIFRLSFVFFFLLRADTGRNRSRHNSCAAFVQINTRSCAWRKPCRACR